MIKVKDGIVKMKGSENVIFTDTVRAAASFCESFAEIKNTSADVMMCCLISATAEPLDLDVKKIARMIKKKEDENDD